MKHLFFLRCASLSVIAIALLCGAWLQTEVMLGPDAGWLIRSAGLMLDGERFGIGIFEPNLPVAWYLCLPAAWAVDFFGLHEIEAIRLWVWALAAVSLLIARACIVQAAERHPVLFAELAAAAVAGCMLVGPSFGQREHLVFLLSLPYVFVVRLRSTGEAAHRRHAIAAGVLAGAAFSIKPVFLVLPIALELVLWMVDRSRLKLLRPETLAIALTGCLSVGFVVAFAPDYLAQVVPAAYATYWAYDMHWRNLLTMYPVGAGIMIGWLIAATGDVRALRQSLVWLAAFLAWSAVYFIQGKGFDYHGFPAMACAFVLSVALLVSLARSFRESVPGPRATHWIRAKRLRVAAAAVWLLVTTHAIVDDAYLWLRSTREGWPLSRASASQELVAKLRSMEVGPGKSVFVFSTNPYPAFPTLNYLGADWVGPDMAQFLLPAWMRRDEIQDAARREAIDAAMAIQRSHVRQAFVEGDPDVILVSKWSSSASSHGIGARRIDFFAIFGSDPVLADAFARYREVANIQGILVYVRND